MNAKNLLTPRKKSAYKMDPNSDRYRVCPNDGVQFMANHRSEIFCGPKCADEHHNLKKKEDAEEKMQAEINAALAAATPEPTNKLAEPAKEPDVVTTFVETKSATITSPLVGNISLIGLTLGNRHSLKVSKKYLPNKGVVYEAYDNRYQRPGTEAFVLTYGPYAIAWGYENHVILTYKKNIPWIQ